MNLGKLSLTPYRLRLFFRGAFLLLALATVALALYLLGEEKHISYKNYQYGFHKTEAQIAGKLHHPAGQLALLNPQIDKNNITPLRPLLLPFSALDFDDQYKVQQAVEMSGCLVQYQDYNSVCVAVGNNPWAGGFVYVAGSFASTDLIPHQRGDRELQHAHRVRVMAQLRGQTYRWIAPFEALEGTGSTRTQGRLTGFVDRGSDIVVGKPVKDFRGWVWQDALCVETTDADCKKRAFFSVRLPVEVLRDALFVNTKITWPPPDLNQIQVRIEILPPGTGAALLDSNSAGATPPFSLSDLKPLLLPGETLRIRKLGDNNDVAKVTGSDEQPYRSSRLVNAILKRLPVDGYDAPLQAREIIATPQGSFELVLTGDVRSLNASLAAVATRVSWFVAAILGAIFLVWLVIEVGIIRRITVLTKRATSVSQSVKGSGGFENSFERFDLADLRGADELGVLASCLADLLQRVKEDVEREHIRAEQEKDLWHAVGHEIMSPLQSLMALHGTANNESSRYINRMQQAIRVLYGSASPSEAFQSTILQMQVVDLNEFLRNVADNAPCVGVAEVEFVSATDAVMVRANEHSLEDVVTHVLRNAERYRSKGTAIAIVLNITDTAANITISNHGPAIPAELIDRIFEYGVSDQPEAGAEGNRGQGLFVAKTYMAKMGGTITVRNISGGVSFDLSLQRVL